MTSKMANDKSSSRKGQIYSPLDQKDDIIIGISDNLNN